MSDKTLSVVDTGLRGGNRPRGRRPSALASTVRGAVLVALGMLPGWSHCGAQAVRAGYADSLCTYQSCALRLQGRSIVAGIEGREVGGFGFFSAPELRPWIELSDSASEYLRVVEQNYSSGKILNLTGALAVGVGVVLGRGTWKTDASHVASVGLVLSGYAALIAGDRRVRRSWNAVQSSMWWYNAALADTLEASEHGRRPVLNDLRPAISRHGARNGLVIGSLAGLGGGLAVSSRHPASETTEGIIETLIGGGVGALLGWQIGRRSGG